MPPQSRLTADQKAKGNEGVRSFVRRLDVLQEVDRSGRNPCPRSCAAAASCAADRLGLRDTLEELRHTVRSSSDQRFRVTRCVVILGNGYDPSVIAAIRAQ